MSMADERGYDQRYLPGYPAAARYTGISESVLRRLVESGKLHAYRPTERKTLFDKAELDALILGSAVRQSV
jgi:excisionase family DNA binding protein